jgi:hypothetical protein
MTADGLGAVVGDGEGEAPADLAQDDAVAALGVLACEPLEGLSDVVLAALARRGEVRRGDGAWGDEEERLEAP